MWFVEAVCSVVEVLLAFAGILIVAYSVPYAIARGAASGISDGRNWALAKRIIEIYKCAEKERGK